MRPDRVAILLNEFPTLTETFILNQIAFLIQRGIEVRIFAMYRGDFSKLHSQYRGYGLEERLTVVGTLPSNWKDRAKEAWYSFKKYGFRSQLDAFFKTTNPFNFGISGLKLTYFLYYGRLYETQSADLIHAHFGQMGSFFSRFVAKGLLNKKPYLVSFHGCDLVPSEYLDNRIRYREMLQTAKLLTVNSSYTIRLLQKVNPEIHPGTRLLPESLDTRLFETKRKPATTSDRKLFKVVFVGRLVDWKGPDTAISIIEKVVKDMGVNNLELSIIGKGPMFPDLEKILEAKGLSNHIKLFGGQEQSKVKSILGEGDLFIYTGRAHPETQRAENQGLVLMEAQAMGLPIVSFDVGGVGEGILDNVTGMLVKAGDLQEFAKQVAYLLGDPARRIAMGEAARTFVATRFDIEILGKRLLEIYEEVLR